MQAQIEQMLALQDSMNQKVHADWRHQGFEWYRAIWIECGELLDHHGWKWWKHQQPDWPQVQLEVIDIWHFGLSDALQQQAMPKQAMEKQAMEKQDSVENGVEDIAAQLASQIELASAEVSLPDAVEKLAAVVLTQRRFDGVAFGELMKASQLDFDQLFRQYIGKNMLNRFRQDHGYKQGHYLKQWQGREDNEHLVEVLNELDSNEPGFDLMVYGKLADRYPG